MKILILGGTRFLGRHLVEAALTRSHEVTLFNRGRSNPDLFPGIERLRGDRDGNLQALKGRRWDAVIDTCGFVPRLVRASTELLADAVSHYSFISTVSVYSDLTRSRVDENAPVHELDDPTTEVIDGESYGGLKVLCERAAVEAMPGRVLNVRAGLIVGPHDSTDRFPYWPRRVARGGLVLAPGRPERQVQFVDVRDLAAWVVKMAESSQAGTFNATGPRDPLTMGGFLDACKRVTASDGTFVWASDAFLKAQEVAPYTEMPLWIPDDLPGFNSIECTPALDQGLAFRPLAETIRDTLAWDASRPAPDSDRSDRPGVRLPGSMRPERETALLRTWEEQSRG
jgi:2'-hydroxyisoflavone reductase